MEATEALEGKLSRLESASDPETLVQCVLDYVNLSGGGEIQVGEWKFERLNGSSDGMSVVVTNTSRDVSAVYRPHGVVERDNGLLGKPVDIEYESGIATRKGTDFTMSKQRSVLTEADVQKLKTARGLVFSPKAARVAKLINSVGFRPQNTEIGPWVGVDHKEVPALLLEIHRALNPDEVEPVAPDETGKMSLGEGVESIVELLASNRGVYFQFNEIQTDMAEVTFRSDFVENGRIDAYLADWSHYFKSAPYDPLIIMYEEGEGYVILPASEASLMA